MPTPRPDFSYTNRVEKVSGEAVPDVRADNHVLAILTSDWHLSLRPPPCRTEEENWLETQAGYISEIADRCNYHKCPCIIAGDIFDDGWRPKRCPPELINWTISQLYKFKHEVYAIPGQHDLPLHSLADIRKSAYWTLRETAEITHLDYPNSVRVQSHHKDGPDLILYGFPWGTTPKYVYHCPTHDTPEGRKEIKLAVIHDYCWREGHAFPGSPQSKHADQWGVSLKGFDAVHFGDNHKGFLYPSRWQDRPNIVNTGTLTRRRSDEENYKPRVGVLYSSGFISIAWLDISKDKFTKVKTLDITSENIDPSFIEFLNEIQDVAINFKESLFRFLNVKKVPTLIQEKILEIMENE